MYCYDALLNGHIQGCPGLSSSVHVSLDMHVGTLHNIPGMSPWLSINGYPKLAFLFQDIVGCPSEPCLPMSFKLSCG